MLKNTAMCCLIIFFNRNRPEVFSQLLSKVRDVANEELNQGKTPANRQKVCYILLFVLLFFINIDYLARANAL